MNRCTVHSLMIAGTLLTWPSLATAQAPASIAALGTCRLQSGHSIADCRVGYRTFGKLNATRSNAVLVPTWFAGQSHELIPLLGSAGWVDTTQFYVVLADALGNGVSSSPSNTSLRPPEEFPAITIRDMVEAQYRLVREHLGLQRLHAVVGGSMGGMQAFEWAVAHPEFVDRLVSLTGSPRTGTYERVNWTTQLMIIEQGRRYGVPDDTIYLQLAHLSGLLSTTPAWVNGRSLARADTLIRAGARNLASAIRLEDYMSQLRAMLVHDVSSEFDGDVRRAANHARPPALVVYSPDDHVVTSAAAETFARQIGAEILSIPSSCGHAVLLCESAKVSSAIQAFLTK